MTTEHTPTPWTKQKCRCGDPLCRSWTVSGICSPQISEANAAFIVRAVNAHDALVKVLAEARDYYTDGNELGEFEQGLYQRIDAALRLAKGSQS